MSDDKSSPNIFARIWRFTFPKSGSVKKDEDAVRIGILGAARIAPNALISPAYEMSDVVVSAVAARDIKRAEEFAFKHGIPKTHSSYQALIDDPEIDAIYNPLPNGLHFEWTMKALQAGKAVLLEKPSTSNAQEAQQLFDYAASKNIILLEAFHYRFHPAVIRVKEILDSGELGKIDGRMRAELEFPNNSKGIIECSFLQPWYRLSMKTLPHLMVKGSKGTLEMYNWMMPTFYHSIQVNLHDNNGRMTSSRTEKHYEQGWSTYRYQLEAFVKAIKNQKESGGNAPNRENSDQAIQVGWVSPNDSISNMAAIDSIYESAGLVKRGTPLNKVIL